MLLAAATAVNGAVEEPVGVIGTKVSYKVIVPVGVPSPFGTELPTVNV